MDTLAEKVSNLLSNPKILHSALSKLQNGSAGCLSDESPGKITSATSIALNVPTVRSSNGSESDSSLELEGDVASTTADVCEADVSSVNHVSIENTGQHNVRYNYR